MHFRFSGNPNTNEARRKRAAQGLPPMTEGKHRNVKTGGLKFEYEETEPSTLDVVIEREEQARKAAKRRNLF